MHFDCPYADAQMLSDRPIGHASDNPSQDVFFPTGQMGAQADSLGDGLAISNLCGQKLEGVIQRRAHFGHGAGNGETIHCSDS